MLSRLLRTIAAHRLLVPGDRVVVAVSGGPDSMALLHALWEGRERLGIALEVAGVDHGLRPEAAGELDLVEERAGALGLPFHRLSVGSNLAGARARGAGLQEAARQARLDALAELAGARHAPKVALGHTADDQAETILFRIVRGTGLAGLAGIPYARGVFVRPLLDVRRSEILVYLRRRSIPFVEDPSNADPRFARARIRHGVLPALARENPRVVEALLGLAAHARSGPGDAPTRERSREGEGATPRRRAGGPPPPPVLIPGPGTYRWSDGTTLEVRITDEAPAAMFDADRVAWPLRARPRLPGDRMRPRGGRGSRKVSDLMIDAKIGREARGALPVVTSAEDQILYVPGLRLSEIARPTATTRRALTVDYLSVV